MPKYMLFPFAEDGTKTAIDNATQPSGLVSWEEGFGADYQGDILTDPDARPFPRAQFNQLCFDMSNNIQYWQQNVFPAFISTSDNGGSPFPYKAGVITQYPSGTGNPLYRSLVNSNTTLPTDTTKWGLYDNIAGKLTLDNATFEGTVVDANVVYFNSGSSNFQKAQANSTAAQFAVGIADATNGRLIMTGQCAVVSGLTAGAAYYLSAGSAGAISMTPSGVKIGVALTATLLLLNIQFLPSYEFYTSNIPFASGVSISSNTPANVTSLSLPSGLWFLSGNVSLNTSALVSGVAGWISLTSATLPDVSKISLVGINGSNFVGTDTSIVVPNQILSLGSTTTLYLSSYATFSAGSTKIAGNLNAVRIGY